MQFIKWILLLITAVIACGGCALAQPAHKEKTIKLLTVGNSFSGNATRYILQLAAAAGHKLVLGRADLPGCPLERHWKAVEAAEADPSAAAGKPYAVTIDGKKKNCSLKDMLTSDKWDFVTIQQASMISTDVSTYRPYARNLRDYIKKHAPQSEVLIHETWAYRVDDPRFSSSSDSQAKMYSQLRAAYRTIAKDLGLRMIPVGDAMYAAETDATWRYRPIAFDKAALKYPDLPDQTHSMHVGWQWHKDGNGGFNLAMDGHHANANGCYLTGCVWFEFLFKENVETNTYIPRGISASNANYLRALAHRIVGAQSSERP